MQTTFLHRRRRLARSILAVLGPQVLDRDMGLDFKGREKGGNFSFTTSTGRKFNVGINVHAMYSAPYDLMKSEKAAEFGSKLKMPFYQGHITFSDDKGSYSITGKGEYAQVISGVASVVSQFLQANPHVATIRFSGSGESRVKVYNRLARTLSGDLGFGFDGNEADGYWTVPSRFFNEEVADAQRARDNTQDSTTEPDEEERELTDEEQEDLDQQRYEEAQERWQQERDSYESSLRDSLEDDEYEYHRTEENDRRDEVFEEAIEELATPIYEKLVRQNRNQMLLWDDPDLVEDIDERFQQQARLQAQNVLLEEFDGDPDEWWEYHMRDMDETFLEQASESVEYSMDEYMSQWESEHDVEDFLE